MPSPPTIRRATPADAGAIVALIQHYVPSGTLLPRSSEFISERAMDFLVAISGSELVGCVHLDEYSPSLGEVRSLVVAPDRQGQGIGALLVSGVEQLARVREFATLFAVSNNEAFFRNRGFVSRDIPELDRERSEVSRFKGVFAKELEGPPARLSL